MTRQTFRLTKRRARWYATLAVVAALSGVAAPAAAQQGLNSRGDIEVFGGTNLRLSGSRALVSTGFQTADSGEHTVLPTLGLSVGAWSKNRVLGYLVDFSFVDGGTAHAQVGSNTSEVKSYLFDFHSGFQVQSPGRIRPYAQLLGGWMHTATSGTLRVFGVSRSIDASENATSLVYGGGVRFMVNDSSGFRVGLDGVSVSTDGGSKSYGRVVFGYFASLK